MDDYVVRNKETFNRLGSAATEVAELMRIATRVLPAFQMLLAGGRVLDLGCGVGHDSLRLKRHRLDVEGLDISEVMLAEAKKQVQGVAFRQGDFRTLPFADISFDGIWANGSLFYVTPDDLREALAEVHRTLKPGGVFFASYLQGEGECVSDSLYHRRYQQAELQHFYQVAGFKTFDPSIDTGSESFLSILAVK
ncbi:class I SAM-dependent methyltransferase [Brevibacillus humidisoli]|uniref:class I SAM-dependent methyltransferase n=1 Tax=Brevibacillus humidisoli TaxID=2895522 RepID=UPI001E3A8382|nr:class I SAM-dependent methyltransferase [Brevibacillus humidisoli]UFJ43076.1 class I SAM-dependent methyltransferase [Brevibacillus humidisoli]